MLCDIILTILSFQFFHFNSFISIQHDPYNQYSSPGPPPFPYPPSPDHEYEYDDYPHDGSPYGNMMGDGPI